MTSTPRSRHLSHHLSQNRGHTRLRLALLGVMCCLTMPALADLHEQVTHGYADNNGVKIHYATLGSGPLVVMIHGFPDYWYSWREQMAGLADRYQVVAIDQRGYNRSDAPKDPAAYDMRHLVGDVAAVIRHFERDKATVVGHDWGGAVAWQVAFALPQMVERLIVLNLPHPKGMANAMIKDPSARANTQYAQKFRAGSPSDPDIFFGGPMTANSLAGWVSDVDARKHYVAAFERSNFDAMLNYYKRNYPPTPEPGAAVPETRIPQLAMPVLMFHGLRDTALPAAGLNDTWNWVDADYTLVTAPKAAHFVQQDAAELVTSTMRWWLDARRED